jgi:hypothetical protein
MLFILYMISDNGLNPVSIMHRLDIADGGPVHTMPMRGKESGGEHGADSIRTLHRWAPDRVYGISSRAYWVR